MEARQEVREITFVPAAEADLKNGERIFRQECLDCHALTQGEGEASWLGSPGFQTSYSDALSPRIRSSTAIRSRPRVRMSLVMRKQYLYFSWLSATARW